MEGKQLRDIKVLVHRCVERNLDERDDPRGKENGVDRKNHDPSGSLSIAGRRGGFFPLPVIHFRQIREDNQDHYRIFDAVEIAPQDTQKGEYPDLVPPPLQNVEKNDDEQIGKEVGSYNQLTVCQRD